MDEIIPNIELCQKKLAKYASNYEKSKLLYYLSKLKHLPIKVNHLELTGVGRSVNALRHIEGSVGEKAKNLVLTWRKMVSAEEISMNSTTPQKSKDDRSHTKSSSVKKESHSPTKSSKQPSPTQLKTEPQEMEPQLSGDDYEDDDDCERLQIAEQAEDGASPLVDDYDPHKSLQSFKEPAVNGGINNKYTSKYNLPCSYSDSSEFSPKYNPFTSTQDYNSIKTEPAAEYQPTTISSCAVSSTTDIKEEVIDPEQSTSHSSDHKNKSKHKDKYRDKKHKTQSKDKEQKSKHSHKSSDKDKSHRDKRKDKDHSSSKKSSHSDMSTNDSYSSLDRRRGDCSKPSNGDIAISPCSSPYYSDALPDIDIAMSNGHENHDKDSKQMAKKKSSSSSNGSSSKSKSSSNSSSSNHKSHNNSNSSNNSSSSHSSSSKKYDKSKKDKKKDREHSDKKSSDDQKSKKRKQDEAFGAALMGIDPSASSSKSKKPKSSHKSKDSKPSNSSESKHRDGSSSSEKDRNSNHESKPGSSSAPLDDSTLHPISEPAPSMLDAIDPNYKPLPRVPLPDVQVDDELAGYPSYMLPANDVQDDARLAQQQTLDCTITSKAKHRRQIYSGKVSLQNTIAEVPSLFDLAVRSLQENIDAIEFTGGIPYDVLKPVIDRATPTQLFNLENYNPDLLADTNHLWDQHCKKNFKNKKPDEMETFRDMYWRLTDERNQKLKSLSQNIKGKKEVKEERARKTQIAFEGTIAKPPKDVARAQSKFGTGTPVGAPSRTTKAAEIIARKQAMVNVQRNERTHAAAASGRAAAAGKKPKAFLMAKTIQFYKKHTFRR